ncbi:hypothetical protein R4579_16645 [Acinetobacter baumannii]|uniref:hypothetical protein n=1 Tax=Acinetobacter TaxID=469 RepID=UPI00045308D6|nr:MULTISPECIES: hypothetical protein [Acinetobacter calcoaceticus/baumannii complex]EXA97822.1 hypothetical protein J507_2509 [Acinetobacter sp. 1295259]MDN8449642.1 hypothetical protein [Acinetobacter baumannii]MDV7473185.1 hypothetical protein [Acinetobacter baumannii]
MDSKTIRYNNTRILVDQVGGVSNFANKINKGQSQTSQFAGTTPIKGIGNKVAREIEEAFGKPHGWLDIPHETHRLDISKEVSGVNSPRYNKLISFFEQIDNLKNEKVLSNQDMADIDIILNNTIRTINEMIEKRIKSK